MRWSRIIVQCYLEKIKHTVKMPSCLAFGCNNTSGRIKGKSFFKIPDPKKHRELCSRWLHNMGNSKWKINNFIPSKDRVLCSDHFNPSCFKRDLKAELCPLYQKKIALVEGAIPTIFTHRTYDQINLDGTTSLLRKTLKRT